MFVHEMHLYIDIASHAQCQYKVLVLYGFLYLTFLRQTMMNPT